MCGIVACVSTQNQTEFLLQSLEKMEYRGYDSSGIALQINNDITVKKAKGKVLELKKIVEPSLLQANCGIGHIRWATHGVPSVENAHPHTSDDIALVHNGIIENFAQLKQELEAKGFNFVSSTDTEVIAHLMQNYLNEGKETKQAFIETLKRLKGSYAIALITKKEPNKIYAARLNSPLVLGLAENTNYVASDTLCLASHAKKAIYLNDLTFAILDEKSVKTFDYEGNETAQEIKPIEHKAIDASKGDYAHFMLKEINEQPEILKNLIENYIDKQNLSIKDINHHGIDFKNIDEITLIGCGTAYNAGLLGQYYLESLAGLSARAEVASEYRYRNIRYRKNGVCIAFSQSGETADTLAAINKAKENGQVIISVLNNVHSSIARLSDIILPINAGLEIGVASTKAFTAQSLVILCLAIYIAKQKGELNKEKEQEIVAGLLKLPDLFTDILQNQDDIKNTASYLQNAKASLYLGRNFHFPIALEGALKLKEISYIHTESYAAGEMKHGPIALIDKNLPVVFLLPNDELYDKSLSNMQEVASRNGQIILLSEKHEDCKHFIKVPEIHNLAKPILYTLPLQLLSYYTALYLKRDIDKPRNLAKSVTVE